YTPASAAGNRTQLIYLPHAGGSATFFATFAREMPDSAEVLAVQYPGRQERRAEPFVDSLPELADHVADALEHAGDLPLALFGHSMGALLAWEVARRLQDRGSGPAHLIVSGRPEPALHKEVRLHLRSDAELIADLRYLSGTAARLLADDGMLRMVLPVLRSDYKAVDSYRYRPGPPLRCPVSVFLGDDDAWADRERAEGWRAVTSGPVAFRTFPGDHFYLAAQWPRIARAVADALMSVPTG
ncbi:thioesterase II family protein, partial [Streptomyces sp. 2MCAF27]